MAKGLGKGLSALISEKKQYADSKEILREIPAAIADEGTLGTLPLEAIQAGMFQPRTYFQEEELNALADSIKQHGIIQPILVRKLEKKDSVSGAEYEIVAGERRFRAARIAGLVQVPIILMSIDNQRAMEIALIENVQRQNLQVLEEAEGYQRLISEFSYTQEQLADVIGRSRSQISNTLRLLQLPDTVKQLLNEEKISAGHARALLAAEEPELITGQILKRGLSVRQTEELVKKWAAIPREQRVKRSSVANQEIVTLQKRISERLGLTLKIKHNDTKNTGELTIHYQSLAELDALFRRLDTGKTIGKSSIVPGSDENIDDSDESSEAA